MEEEILLEIEEHRKSIVELEEKLFDLRTRPSAYNWDSPFSEEGC